MQVSLSRSNTPCAVARNVAKPRTRSVTVRAIRADSGAEAFQRGAAAFGAALLLASPFAGPAIARPSDFIQSKPSSNPGEATNVDKFPFNPSVSGQPARENTQEIKNPQGAPREFSTTKGLGKAMTDNAEGGGEDGMIPSPLDDGPNPDKVGS